MVKEVHKVSIVTRPHSRGALCNLLPTLTSWLSRRRKVTQFLLEDAPLVQDIFGHSSAKAFALIRS